MRRRRNILYVFTICCVILCGILFCNTTIYASEEVIASGECGDNLVWKLYDDGNMTISGIGAMWDMYTDEGFANTVECPWKKYRTQIKNVNIESGVTVIGSASFRNCLNLEKVKFPNTLKSINIRAFWGCKKLENCTLPEGLERIEERIFYDCDSMTSVTIPDSINFLGAELCDECDNLKYFYIGMTEREANGPIQNFIGAAQPTGYCPSLESIEVSEKCAVYRSINGVLYLKHETTLCEYPTGKKDKIYYVENGTTKIYDNAFNRIDNLEELILPEGLLEVGAGFLRKCHNITSLILPSTLQKAFEFGSIVSCDSIVYVENKSDIIFALDKLTENTLWVDENGNKVTEIGKGKAYQYRPIYDISLSENIQLEVGETVTLPESITYWDKKIKKYPKDLIFTSSNPSVATISEDGIVTAVSEGSATITIKPRYFRRVDRIWEKKCTILIGNYNIKYVLNGGINNKKNPSSYNKTTDTIILQKPTRKGYEFAGWYTDKDYTKRVTQIKKGSTGDITLYAKWIANKYNIKFYGNGSTSGKMSILKNRVYGSKYKLSANKFKRKGYTFTGWNTKKDGSGEKYNNKAYVKNLTSTNKKTVKLYAQWKKEKYTITYKLNGGKNNSKNPNSYYITTSTKKLYNPTRKGYVFKGWYADKKCTKKITQIKKGSTGNIKLYAKWVKK